MASATPMFPEVGSTRVPPGLSNPLRSASSTTASAIRSLTLRPGLHASTFAQTVAGSPAVIRLSRMRGVLPTASRTLGKILDIGSSGPFRVWTDGLLHRSSNLRHRLSIFQRRLIAGLLVLVGGLYHSMHYLFLCIFLFFCILIYYLVSFISSIL